MDDFELDEFRWLPGIDLYLWLRVLLAALALVALSSSVLLVL